MVTWIGICGWRCGCSIEEGEGGAWGTGQGSDGKYPEEERSEGGRTNLVS